MKVQASMQPMCFIESYTLTNALLYTIKC